MSYSFLEQSKRDGSLVLWHDYRRWNQTFLDLSGQGNDAAAMANLWWGGGGVQFNDSNGYIQVADAAELQFTLGTVVALGEFTRLEGGGNDTRLLSKRDAGGTQFEFRLDNTPRLEIYDGTGIRSLNHDYRGNHYLAIDIEDGEISEGWADGLSIGNFNAACAYSVDDAPLYIGNYYLFNRSLNNPMWAALIFNDILTSTEHAELFGELMALPGGEH